MALHAHCILQQLHPPLSYAAATHPDPFLTGPLLLPRLHCAQNVDFVGLDPSQEHLLYYASSPESLKELKVPYSVVKRFGSMTIVSDLTNAHLYVFNRCVTNREVLRC